MKIKTTMKFINNNFSRVYRAGYCDLDDIFTTREPVYYNCGIYGWNCDIYIDYAHDTAFTTGYRNLRGEKIPSDILKKYKARAKMINDKMFSISCDKWKEEMEENLNSFLEELAM